MHSKKFYYVALGLLACLVYFPLFSFLNVLPIRVWDEARVTANALAMFHNGNYITTFFENQPDLWNTKPPFLIWCQVISMKIFGVSELAIRFPSALAGFLTCAAVFYFCKNYLKEKRMAFFAVIILISMKGFVRIHGTRTGDYDAMLTLFTTIYLLSFFAWLIDGNKKALFISLLGITLAVFTKSIAGLLFMPSLLISTIAFRKLKQTLTTKHFYAGILSFLIIIGGYFTIRESQHPGYLNAIMETDITGRYSGRSQGNVQDFWYYWQNLYEWQLSFPVLVFAVGITAGFLSEKKLFQKLTLYLTICLVGYFLVISCGETKLNWYTMPMFPLFAILLSMLFETILSYLPSEGKTSIRKIVIVNALFFALIYNAYSNIITETYKPVEYFWDWDAYVFGHYLKDVKEKKVKPLKKMNILYNDYYTQFAVYNTMITDQKFEFHINQPELIEPGDTVLLGKVAEKQAFLEKYNAEFVQDYKGVFFYRVVGKK